MDKRDLEPQYLFHFRECLSLSLKPLFHLQILSILQRDHDRQTEYQDNILNYENIDSNRDELVLNFKINFSETTLENDEFPSSFNCSFSAFDQEFHFYFKYRSFAFSENTPVYMWNGLILEKRIDGKVFF